MNATLIKGTFYYKIIMIKRLHSITRHSAILYMKSMKFGIQEGVLLRYQISSTSCTKWQNDERKCLTIIIWQEKVPFRKLGHIYIYLIARTFSTWRAGLYFIYKPHSY